MQFMLDEEKLQILDMVPQLSDTIAQMVIAECV